MKTEQLLKASQCADLLVSDIQQAHSASCGNSTEEQLLEIHLLSLLKDALEVQSKLQRLAAAFR